jgi:hypothetical protein
LITNDLAQHYSDYNYHRDEAAPLHNGSPRLRKDPAAAAITNDLSRSTNTTTTTTATMLLHYTTTTTTTTTTATMLLLYTTDAHDCEGTRPPL